MGSKLSLTGPTLSWRRKMKRNGKPIQIPEWGFFNQKFFLFVFVSTTQNCDLVQRKPHRRRGRWGWGGIHGGQARVRRNEKQTAIRSGHREGLPNAQLHVLFLAGWSTGGRIQCVLLTLVFSTCLKIIIFFRWRFRDWRNNDLRGWMERQSLCSCRRCFGWGKWIWIEIKLNYCYIDFIFVFQYLYDLLMNLLEEKGISNEFVQKLSDFSTCYEHSSYIGLLEGISKFTIDKK